MSIEQNLKNEQIVQNDEKSNIGSKSKLDQNLKNESKFEKLIKIQK